MGARAVRGGGESFEVNATFDAEVATLSMKRRSDAGDADDGDASGAAGLRSKMAAAVTMRESERREGLVNHLKGLVQVSMKFTLTENGLGANSEKISLSAHSPKLAG